METTVPSRFQVAAFFARIILTCQLANILLTLIPYAIFVLSSGPLGSYSPSSTIGISSSASGLLVVFFWPLVSLMARAMTGNKADEPFSMRDLRALFLPCLGWALLVASIPSLTTGLLLAYREMQLTTSTPLLTSLARGGTYLLIAVVKCSIGLALTIYPSVRDQIREPNQL